MALEKVAYTSTVLVEQHTLFSQYLEREVMIDCYLPRHIPRQGEISLLLFNDGQDLPKIAFDILLDGLFSANLVQPLLCVGIHCGPDRINEYGTAYSPDYKGRGAKAGLYTKFVMDELLPFIRATYHTPSFKDKSFAGFSLGALSALDIAWNHANEFYRVGVFSGSLWWRRKAYEDGYDEERDRLMHLQVQQGDLYPWLRLFIQCGALDEVADRNKNGIIDSIDDAQDLVHILKARGYTDEHIHFLLLPDGRHDIESWGKALPVFLQWGWGK